MYPGLQPHAFEAAPHMPGLHPYASQVFVLGRMGLNCEALGLMLEQRGDMERAIEF